MIYTPEQTEAILKAIESIELANNGWSYVSAGLVQHLTADGYVVLRSTDLHGLTAYKAYTKRAQEALKVDGESTYKKFSLPIEAPDYEAAILARQAIFLE